MTQMPITSAVVAATGMTSAAASRSPTEGLDRMIHAQEARWTLSLSPAALILAGLDWTLHLANAPGRRMELAEAAFRQWIRLADYAWRRAGDPAAPPAILPDPGDRRFGADAWQQPPFDLLSQGFLLTEEWWRRATTGVRGVSCHHERLVAFAARQLLDMMAPTNFPATNPEVIQASLDQGGANLWHGLRHALDSHQPASSKVPRVGRDMATTPGEVVLRNDLIELIRYSPATETVHPEPILIVPAWIMKYYILDLNRTDSLIRYLVGRGHQVYAISWRNPGPEFAGYGMDEYRKLGVMAALDAIGTDRPGVRIHGCGYCLGGTLLSIAAAAMARDGDDRLASLTLLAAQADFTEAGELQLFVDESQLAWLEDVMADKGYLESSQMAAAFTMLRSVDLVWSRMVAKYLLGQEPPTNDLMAWNADATRMPYRMHAEYLRRLFLRNDLAEGRYPVDGRPVALGDIQLPSFLVGTETDHVAPWRSVFKYLLLTDGEARFVLTSGGHNAGIVSPPDHPRRHYRIVDRPAQALHPSADAVLASAPADGSWWPVWADWLAAGSRAAVPISPPGLAAIEAAPGHYVFEA